MQKAGLIVTDGGTDSRIPEVPDYRLGGKLRDKVRVDTGFLQSVLVESTAFRVEKPMLAALLASMRGAVNPHSRMAR